MITVNIDGTTDQHNYYPESWQKRDRNRNPRSSGWYSTKRTRAKAVCVGKVHATLAKDRGDTLYFITHTCSPGLVSSRPVGMPQHGEVLARRERWRKFLDLLRKQPGYKGVFWAAERHTGNGDAHGLLHHHAVARFSGRWNYAPHVRKWSLRYCSSVNGLDIGLCKRRNPHGYLSKVFGYMCKDTGSPDAIPVRWWGSSKVVRRWRQENAILLPLSVPAGAPFRARCARVSDLTAIKESAWRTAQLEQQKVKEARLDTWIRTKLREQKLACKVWTFSIYLHRLLNNRHLPHEHL